MGGFGAARLGWNYRCERRDGTTRTAGRDGTAGSCGFYRRDGGHGCNRRCGNSRRDRCDGSARCDRSARPADQLQRNVVEWRHLQHWQCRFL